ncbi:MAG: DHH family phosphoesterase [Alloprevotella sp.]|nr:DHH family phosphoesterase [Alloprevotella sp.]MBR1594936.1 DHH family phosphoesterase [Alloprevotella sp.]
MDATDHLHLLPPTELYTLMRMLRESRNVVVCAHRSPDGDAMGSTLAWATYLHALGKRVSIVLPNPAPDFLQWLPGAQRIVHFDRQAARGGNLIRQADLICCLDFNTLGRLQDMGQLLAGSKAKRILIDHHLDPDAAAFDFLVSRPDLSSTCEVVFRLLMQLGAYEDMDAAMATCLYCGMMTDTGNFAYASSRPEVYEIIGLLLRRGIDKDRIYRNVFFTFSPDRLRLQGFVLYEKLRWLADGRAALFTLSREEMKAMHFVRGDGEGLVNLPLQVRGARLSISLREDTERDVIRVSLRSVDDFPCNRMAEEFFNGGGHLNASGGELPFPMEEAVRTVERAVEAYREQLLA